MSKIIRVVSAFVLAALPALTACGEDPFALNWTAQPDTAVLHSLAAPLLNTYSGYDFNDRIPIRVVAPNTSGGWDIALDTRAGRLVFIAPGALGIVDEALILRLPDTDYEEVTKAPSDTTLYTASEPLLVDGESTYVIRTREDLDRFGRRCVFWAKLQPLEVDQEQETVRFLFDRNPICNDRNLVPDAN